jgi:hypothetical protein
MNFLAPGADFKTVKFTFESPNGRTEEKINYVFIYTLPDDEGNQIEIKFNKLKICTEDGEEKYMWVLCSEPFEVKDEQN